MEVINKEDLFCDEYRAMLLWEYPRELDLIKRLINIAEESVGKQERIYDFTYERICYMFAKSIVDYSKMAYDNMLLGHFDVVNMIYRVIVENVACLDIIIHDEKEELWKYYLVHSFKNAAMKGKAGLAKGNLRIVEEMYDRLNIDKEFYENGKKKIPYIDLKYGWTYKINNKFSFAGLCDLTNKREYEDFKFMSEYSHGTAIHLKMDGFASIDRFFGMMSSIYIGLYRTITMYCWEKAGEEFDEVSEEIEAIIYSYIEKSEG